MSLRRNPLAGPGYIILNILRVWNIVALLAVVVASWIMLVKTFNISKFFFFDAISHIITSSLSLFLIASELNIFRGYFLRNWPLLSPTSGFVTLGFAMIIVGVSILGNLNKEATSQESLGLPFWRIVIASGILAAVLGFLNVIVSFIFRDTVLSITARQVRSKGAVATSTASRAHSNSSRSNSTGKSLSAEPLEKEHKRFTMSLPKYHRRNERPTERTSRVGPKVPINISRPMGVNPQFKDYITPIPQDPSPGHHPIFAEMSRERIQVPSRAMFHHSSQQHHWV